MVYIEFFNRTTREIIPEDVIRQEVFNALNDKIGGPPFMLYKMYDCIWMDGISLNRVFNTNLFTREQLVDYYQKQGDDLDCEIIQNRIHILTKYGFRCSG